MRKPDPLIVGWSAAAAPPPRLTVSEWADLHRVLPESSGAKGARWRTELTPYLGGIMNAVHEPGVRKIVVRKCAQVGGSEALHNILGYFIAHDPCSMLFVHPTVEVAEEWSKERLADMIRSTPALSAVIREKRASRGSHEGEGSTLSFKTFPGGFLALGGANTPNTFARRACRLAIGDDVDRFPAVVGDEGDPADLLENRTTTFHDALVLFVSTPTLKGGRIDTLYTRSDQRQYFMPCPHCGREDWITWNDPRHVRVVFQEDDPDSARIECPSVEYGGCGGQLYEPERLAMLPRGEWLATTNAAERGLVGFHLPAMLSTFVSLPQLVSKWLAARARGKESLRVFINTSLAEGWEDRGARMDSHVLFQRREDYGEGIEVPGLASALTAGVDVQDDRFEFQVFGWGPAGERWVVDYQVIPGDPRLPETQSNLLEALGRRYRHALGPDLPLHAVCVDTGHFAQEMYDFVLRNQHRRIYGTKGYAGRSGEPIVGKPSEKRHGNRPRPIRLYPINVDDAKTELMSSLALLEPGPGYLHFPIHLEAINDEYFAQLCAEHRETRYNRAGIATHSVWVQDRDRNEALDTAVLALAAFRLLNPNLRQMREAIVLAGRRSQEPTAGATTPPSIPPQRSTTPGRRVARSSYLLR